MQRRWLLPSFESSLEINLVNYFKEASPSKIGGKANDFPTYLHAHQFVFVVRFSKIKWDLTIHFV